MKEKNFLKNSLTVAGAALISVLPNKTNDNINSKLETPVISNEIVKEQLTDEKAAKYENNIEDKKSPEYFMSRESIDSTVKSLRERVLEEIRNHPVDSIKDNDGNLFKIRLNYHTGYDHVLLAIGDEPINEGTSYYKYINKLEDSLDLKDEYSNYLGDSHANSIAYSLLRTGVYDKWKKAGGELSVRADSIIDRAKNPVEDFRDFKEHDYEWTMLIYLELAKRGLDTTFLQYVVSPEDFFTSTNQDKTRIKDYLFDKTLLDSTKQLSIDELYKLNEDEFEALFDNRKYSKDAADVREKIYQKRGVDIYVGSERTCKASHALHALTTYDLFSNNSAKLEEHLDAAAMFLEDYLKKEDLHYISHFLLPFTELPNDFKLDPDKKKIVQSAVERIISLGEKEQNTMELAHVIEVLTHLPDCVLEK